MPVFDEFSLFMLILMNLIAWFWPAFFLSSTARWSYIFVAFVFSQSYFFLVLYSRMFGIDYPVTVVSLHVDLVLLYSFVAGAVYSVCFFLVGRRYNKVSTVGKSPVLELMLAHTQKYIPRLKVVPLLILLLIITTLFCLVFISEYSNVGDRRVWVGMSESDIWNTYRSILGLVIGAVFLLSSRLVKGRGGLFVVAVSFLLLFLFLILMGFDGARKQAVFPMASFFYLSLIAYRFNIKVGRVGVAFFFLGIILISFFSLTRNFDVGWSVIYNFERLDFNSMLRPLLIPMSTLHVNTHMVDYVQAHGYQGSGSYVSAFINTAFPNFIFGTYYGGTPLVTKLHTELGWFGFDFGLLAEAIYAGGMKYVVIIHFVLACYHALLLKFSAKGSLSAMAFFASFHIAIIQGLRSDFMNILKWAIYPAIFILVLVVFWRVLKGMTKKI